jgi:hypothetical protein
VVLKAALAGKCLIGKLRNLIGVCKYRPEKLLLVHFWFCLWKNRSAYSHRFVDQTLDIALRLQAASLNLRGKLVRDGAW